MEHSIDAWVKSSSNVNSEFKKAAHIILTAISTSDYLKPKMIMKGGVLLAIRYESSRHTTDIDFSSAVSLMDIDKDEFVDEMNDSLMYSSDQLSYDVKCLVQSAKINPRNPDASFPSFKLTIGYASTRNANELARLERKESPKTIKIDYSFNELTLDIEDLSIGDGESINVYGFTDIIAEKFRAILQQVIRDRSRRQDVYDLKFLIDKIDGEVSDTEKYKILNSLIEKSKGRIDLDLLNENSLDNPDVRARSKQDYFLLQSEIVGQLYDFDMAYDEINLFYKSLPWEILC